MYVSFDIVFFFKQKTAYDMRISDWSSDVCSSDLYRKGLGFSRYLRASQLTSPPSSVNGFCLSRPTSDTHVMLPTIDSLAPWRSNSSQNRVGDHWTARPQDESARLGPTHAGTPLPTSRPSGRAPVGPDARRVLRAFPRSRPE